MGEEEEGSKETQLFFFPGEKIFYNFLSFIGEKIR